jgi:hypothetical protein
MQVMGLWRFNYLKQVKILKDDGSAYGNPGIGACCSGFSEGGGVIGFGDEGDIGFGVVGGGIEAVVGVGVVVAVVTFFIVFGIPHICDSVVLTNLSFGLLGSHSFDLSCGDTVALVGEGGGDEVEGGRAVGGVFCSNWAWLPLIIPISNTAPIATIATIATAVKLIFIGIFNVLNIDTVCIIG